MESKPSGVFRSPRSTPRDIPLPSCQRCGVLTIGVAEQRLKLRGSLRLCPLCVLVLKANGELHAQS